MGYIGTKRSERSQQAIDDGFLVYSQLKAWQKRAVDAGAVSPCEWHHTGKYFQQTNYFNPEDFKAYKASDFPPKKKENESTSWYVLVSAIWGGTKRYPKIIGYDVNVTNKVTKAQMNAKKYYAYGGELTVFDTREEAEAYAAIKRNS